MRELNPDNVIILDETGSNLAFSRSHARSLQGKRPIGDRPCQRGQNVTVLAEIGTAGVAAHTTFDGALNGPRFIEWRKHSLCPTLKPGNVVAMDNRQVYKVADVKEAIEATGATLLYLPAYSPDYSPEELMWAWMKNWFRALEVRDCAILPLVVAPVLRALPVELFANWLRHCGWNVPAQVT
ncbi:transposase [Lujinxingia vulgaris]|uniref:Transposase n=1 Tax=Lujinxingia vulgaris TaxID=2600176 RepID=A0A5C6X966_9DELT|nr:transposase [Lujinxingia vulgaris]TXD36895.1 transposase [Lujinxingia vulgaris]